MLTTVKAVLLILLCSVAPATAAPEPAFTYQSMLNTYFDDESGLIRISDIDLAFAPEGEINAAVVVTDSENTVIQSHKFYPDPRWREGVYARLTEVGPADFNLTEPGVYNIIYLIDGKPVSRLPVVLEQTSEGDDPFDPVKKYRFFGIWQLYSYLTMNTLKDEPFPQLNLWLGGKDLAEGETKDMFSAKLILDGEVIAHSRETQGFFTEGHYEPTEISFYYPHTRREIANAKAFMYSDWVENDGDYTIDIARRSDDAVIRSFKFTVTDGEIESLPSTELDFDPHVDYIVPRVTERGAGQYGFVKAIWLKVE